jgi:hypothetical protein
MELLKIILRFYGDKQWMCGNTYDSLEWYDNTIPKPTQDELYLLNDQLLIDEMREKRNKLLQESDFRALSDYPDREKWIDYRQQLRDFPTIWALDISFPIQPE